MKPNDPTTNPVKQRRGGGTTRGGGRRPHNDPHSSARQAERGRPWGCCSSEWLRPSRPICDVSLEVVCSMAVFSTFLLAGTSVFFFFLFSFLLPAPASFLFFLLSFLPSYALYPFCFSFLSSYFPFFFLSLFLLFSSTLLPSILRPLSFLFLLPFFILIFSSFSLFPNPPVLPILFCSTSYTPPFLLPNPISSFSLSCFISFILFLLSSFFSFFSPFYTFLF